MSDGNHWISAADGAALLEFLPRLSAESAAVIERRVLAPWQRRQHNLARRDTAILRLAGDYIEASGRKMSAAIARDLRRPGSAPPSRRELIDRVLAHGRPPGADTIRRVLAGLGKNQAVPFTSAGDTRDDPEVTEPELPVVPAHRVASQAAG